MEEGASISMWGTGRSIDLSCGLLLPTNLSWGGFRKGIPSLNMGNRAVFLDRDGTINEEVGYLEHLERFRLLPEAGRAIRLLNRHHFKTVVITNQSGVARGYFLESRVHEVHKRMKDLLRLEGARLDGIYYCPHHPDEKCRCRKPETGLVEEASRDLHIDCSRSYVVGDRRGDIEFAHKIGAKGILVLTGYGREERESLGGSGTQSLSTLRRISWMLSSGFYRRK